MRGVAKTQLTPDMLTLAGVTLCLAGAVLVYFEYRNEYLFFWLGGVLFVVGSIADILDGALARAAARGRSSAPSSTRPSTAWARRSCSGRSASSFMHDGNEVALVFAFAAVIGSFLVWYTRAKAESLGLKADVGFGSRVERVVLISIGLVLAPWGLLQWAIYVLAATAWFTVGQRILFVRRSCARSQTYAPRLRSRRLEAAVTRRRPGGSRRMSALRRRSSDQLLPALSGCVRC